MNVFEINKLCKRLKKLTSNKIVFLTLTLILAFKDWENIILYYFTFKFDFEIFPKKNLFVN